MLDVLHKVFVYFIKIERECFGSRNSMGSARALAFGKEVWVKTVIGKMGDISMIS